MHRPGEPRCTAGAFDFDRLEEISRDLSVAFSLIDMAINAMAPKAGADINLLFGAIAVLDRSDKLFQAVHHDLLHAEPRG